MDTIVLEEDTIPIFSNEYAVSIFDSEVGSSKFLRNICIHPKGLYDIVTQKDTIEMFVGCENNKEFNYISTLCRKRISVHCWVCLFTNTIYLGN